MDYLFENIKTLLQGLSSNAPGFYLALLLFSLLALLLGLGRRLELALKLERLGVPIALLVGTLALLVGPYGYIHLMPEVVTDIWVQLPTPLLTLVFATLMIGRPLPKAKGLFKPVLSQALLGLLLGFGQYLVGGLIVIFILSPYLDVDPLMGCLIEVGFEGGHGAASVMGNSFKQLGFSAGLDLGLAMATVGLLTSTIIGSFLVILGRWRGWLEKKQISHLNTSKEDLFPISFVEQIKVLALNLGLAGACVGVGVSILKILQFLGLFFGNGYSNVINIFPVFPLTLLSSLLFRYVLEKTSQTKIVSPLLQREIGTLCTDLLIVTAMASLNLELLKNDWIPVIILAASGLIWNLIGMLVLSRIIFHEEWFERSITEFGNATGVAASGLLLLRLSDPLNDTNALPIFSIKQLFLQPLLSGGLITVLAPVFVTRIGLLGWTEISGLLTVLFLIIAIVIKVPQLNQNG